MRANAGNLEELKLDSSDCEFQNVSGVPYAHLWLFVKISEKRLF